MTKEQARARVARGAALLDEKRPGWAEHINTRALNMADDCRCVLGQLEGSYHAAVRRLWVLRGLVPHGTRKIAAQHGLYAHGPIGASYTNHEYQLLTNAWIEAIADRLTPPVVWQPREKELVSQ